MKKLSIILFLCVSVCNFIFASAAHPGPYLRVQPNGDSIYVYWRADEYGGYYTDLKKNVIAENEEGYWVYVKIKRGKWFLTNQVVSKTSTPKKIDKEAVMDYIAEARKKARRKRHGGLPEFTIKNERVKKWMNPKIKWSDIIDPTEWCKMEDSSWLVRNTNFGRHDFSCLLLYKNDSTNRYYFVNYYMDFFTRLGNTHDVVSVVDVYRCYGKSMDGGAVLNSNFFEQINIPQNKQLQRRVNKMDRIFSRKYKRVNKLAELMQEKNKKYNCKEYSICEDCEDFFNTHTLVDVIGYSYITYPMGIENKIK